MADQFCKLCGGEKTFHLRIDEANEEQRERMLRNDETAHLRIGNYQCSQSECQHYVPGDPEPPEILVDDSEEVPTEKLPPASRRIHRKRTKIVKK